MKILAFETSSEKGTVALQVDMDISEESIATPRQQTEQLLPLAQKLLASAGLRLADLDGIAFGRGPGSFTGLRIAAAAAQGLSLASGLPLLPVSSLAAIAQGLWRARGIRSALVCIDAHMGEVFWAGYNFRDGLAQAVGEERLTEPVVVSADGLEEWTAAGSGFAVYKSPLEPLIGCARSVLTEARPRAMDLFPQAVLDLAEGHGRRPEEATPVYLRSEAAWQK